MHITNIVKYGMNMGISKCISYGIYVTRWQDKSNWQYIYKKAVRPSLNKKKVNKYSWNIFAKFSAYIKRDLIRKTVEWLYFEYPSKDLFHCALPHKVSAMTDRNGSVLNGETQWENAWKLRGKLALGEEHLTCGNIHLIISFF